MNEKQCKELRKAIVEKFPHFKNYSKFKSSSEAKEREVYFQFRKVYQKAKIQFKNTLRDKKQVITII